MLNEFIEKILVHERDRATESRKPHGMGAADERLQGAGRGDCESGIDL